ncbi:MAG: carboxypeptidase-like regulatory domain-containing protein [Planctomycetota bacterium]
MQRSFTSMSRFLVVLALCPCLAAMVGCRDGVSGPTGTVSGKVTYNESPAPAGCTVTFVHDKTSMAATGQTGADGSYSLQMRGEGKVPVGAYQITVSPPAGDAQPGSEDPEAYRAVMEGGGGGQAESKPAFPDKYLTATTSELTFTVKEGPNTFDVEMTDDGAGGASAPPE